MHALLRRLHREEDGFTGAINVMTMFLVLVLFIGLLNFLFIRYTVGAARGAADEALRAATVVAVDDPTQLCTERFNQARTQTFNGLGQNLTIECGPVGQLAPTSDIGDVTGRQQFLAARVQGRVGFLLFPGGVNIDFTSYGNQEYGEEVPL